MLQIKREDMEDRMPQEWDWEEMTGVGNPNFKN